MTNPNDSISPLIETQELRVGSETSIPVVSSMGGLTKREYFAAMAMQGILATTPHDYSDGRYNVNGGYLCHESVAKDAVECADALIEALNK